MTQSSTCTVVFFAVLGPLASQQPVNKDACFLSPRIKSRSWGNTGVPLEEGRVSINSLLRCRDLPARGRRLLLGLALHQQCRVLRKPGVRRLARLTDLAELATTTRIGLSGNGEGTKRVEMERV